VAGNPEAVEMFMTMWLIIITSSQIPLASLQLSYW